jgi:hypothetical protein
MRGKGADDSSDAADPASSLAQVVILAVIAQATTASNRTGLTRIGLLAVMGLQQAETGRWDGFLLVEAKYGTGLHNPADTFEKNAVRQAPPPGAPEPEPCRCVVWWS